MTEILTHVKENRTLFNRTGSCFWGYSREEDKDKWISEGVWPQETDIKELKGEPGLGSAKHQCAIWWWLARHVFSRGVKLVQYTYTWASLEPSHTWKYFISVENIMKRLHIFFSWQNALNWSTIKRFIKRFKKTVSAVDTKSQ